MDLKSWILEPKQEITLSACRVMELTIDLLFDILSRLPTETIFSCRCVCKQFLNILTDPYFAKLHLSKAPKGDHTLILLGSYYPSEFSLTNIYDLEKIPSRTSSNSDHRSHSSIWRNFTIPDIISNANEKYIASLVGSCNGLICISYAKQGLTIFYICNPILGEFIRLPQHTHSVYHHGAAFGFCENTKQYKVVRFINTSQCEIHSLGTDYWTRIENVPYPNNPYSFDSSLNGNLHWVTTSSNTSKLICSLNLVTEQFHYISPPPHFNDSDTRRRISSIRVGEKGGLFCVFYVVDKSQFEICVMKEYGVQASWTKEFGVKLMFNFKNYLFPLTPLGLLSNGDLLFRYKIVNLIHYSFQNDTFKELITQECSHVVGYVPSFVSLKEIVGDKNVEVVRRNKCTLND